MAKSNTKSDQPFIEAVAATVAPLGDSAVVEPVNTVVAAPAVAVPVVNKPRRGGSYVVDPNTGALVAAQPKKEK